MAFTTGGGGNSMSDMNVTPLVDVMLVLLIIFMVTAPVASHNIQIDLPQPTRNPPPQPVDPPEPIRLRIDAGGALYWNNSPLPQSALEPSLRVESIRDPQPMLEIETNADAQYQSLAGVLALAKNSGMKKIGFVDTN